MKKITLLFVFLGYTVLSVANNPLSKVIFYRDNNYQGSAMSFKVYVNDSLIVKLKNSSYYEYNCPPGDYNIYVKNYQGGRLLLKVEEGRTYYVRVGLNVSFWTSTPELLLVDSLSAHNIIYYNSSMRKLDGTNAPMNRPKNRININSNFGGGFQSHPIFITTDGKDAEVSFGGGIGIGVSYGCELSRYFDILAGIDYKSSWLSPALQNGDASFNRAFISLTPAFIIPIDGGDAMRFKLGGGVNYYFSNKFNMEGSEIPGGFDDKWTYSSTFGYHLSFVFEINVGENFSLNYGLKYYGVNYDFHSGRIAYPLNGNKLKNPDGSGLDFIIGMGFHF